MTAADELRTAAASIRAGDMPADPDKFLAAVADWLEQAAAAVRLRQNVVTGAPIGESANAQAVARAWNADRP